MQVLGVARAVRIEYEGAFYHVMARGNRRERIFRDEADRLLFYQTGGEACKRTGWRVHAWVLMSNHYHLMVETPEANLVAGMRWLQETYTRRYNCRHGLWARLPVPKPLKAKTKKTNGVSRHDRHSYIFRMGNV